MTMTKSKKNLNRDIMEYVTRYGPCTARSIAEDMNKKYDGNVTSWEVASRLRGMCNAGSVVETGQKDNGGMIYRVGAVL